MEIVGRGFIAKNLEPIADAHPDVVVLAAGVSRTTATSRADFLRERRLVEEHVRRCQRDGRRLVFLSTASTGVYGSSTCDGREDTPVQPLSPYAAHKISLEHLLQNSAVDYLALRLSHLVGPHQRPWQLLPSLVAQVQAGRVQVRRGAQRDLLEVGDMRRITDALLREKVVREVVNVASGQPVAVERVVQHIEWRLGCTPVHDLVEVDEPSIIDVTKLRKLVPEVESMGFGPRYYCDVLDSYLGVPTSTH
jgi:nucleoside-diphosphate-sugar epimerase